MFNVNKRLEKYEQIKNSINNRLDKLSEYKQNYISINHNKIYSDLQSILNSNFSENYLNELNKMNCYSQQLFSGTISEKKSPLILEEVKKSFNKPASKEMGVGTDLEPKLTEVSFKPLQIDNYNCIEKVEKIYSDNKYMKLKINLNKIKNKMKLIDNINKNQLSVKNSNFLNKLIGGYIEKLAINWNEVVDMLIMDLIEQEIYNLNELEMERIKENNIEEKYLNGMLLSNNESINNKLFQSSSIAKESLLEINQIISSLKLKENEIFSKYLINLNN